MNAWMSAGEAAGHLGVSRQTLYAYVSRGLLRPDKLAGARASRYRRAEVERLAAARRGARNPRQAARATLDWGLPVLNSALTLVRDGRLYYRGQDALALAESAALEEVAALMWSADACDIAAAMAAASMRVPAPGPRGGRGDPRACLAAFQAILGGRPARAIGEEDAPAREAVAGARLLAAMRTATTGRTLPAGAIDQPLHAQLAALWRCPRETGAILRAALVLCADHELNASSFASRCVASTGAALDACVTAGLAALSGPRHGGATASIEAAWDDWMALPRTRAQRREGIRATIVEAPAGCTPQGLGFGHPLYPEGDPRAAILIARLPREPRRERFVAEVYDMTGLRPSVDFALVALRRALGLPRGAAFALFAIGRTVGWIAHALEQRRTGSLIRPRAAYVGPLPVERAAAPSVPGRIIRRR